MRKKIFFSFFISAFIIAVLAGFQYVTFVEVKDEMRSLETTDTIRSKSLQLRRHEKNFLLYASDEELTAIYDYLGQLENITSNPEVVEKSPRLQMLVAEYKERFDRILALLEEIRAVFYEVRPSFAPNERFAALLETSFLDRPGYAARSLIELFGLPEGHRLVHRLRELDGEMALLRENGEDIITHSKQLDAVARSRAERGIRISQAAVIAVFPVFLAIGLVALFLISNDLVRRLNTLTGSVEKTASRYMTSMTVPEKEIENMDEVDVLVSKFGRMGMQLDLWEKEIRGKNRELLESKKLAAIGTLASGVAHELNNPLNNIFLSVQVLKRQLGGDAPPLVMEIVEDVYAQTLRVKGIVGDLLEFAREREPVFEDVELGGVITGAYDLVRKSAEAGGISFVLDPPSPAVSVRADRGLLERVFVNLFSNAVAAIEGSGKIAAKVEEGGEAVRIRVSDTGRGISAEDREKIFDPFFTKKEKGTGLGLAIVKNIVNKHRGTITVESEPGRGTVFEVSIPKDRHGVQDTDSRRRGDNP